MRQSAAITNYNPIRRIGQYCLDLLFDALNTPRARCNLGEATMSTEYTSDYASDERSTIEPGCGRDLLEIWDHSAAAESKLTKYSSEAINACRNELTTHANNAKD